MAKPESKPKRKYTRREAWGSIRELPSGNFQAAYSDPHTHKRVRAPMTFAKRAAARRWLMLERARLELGQEPQALASHERKEEGAATPTVREYALKYLSKNESRWSPNSMRSMKSRLDVHILPPFGALKIDEVTEDHVREWWEGLSGASDSVKNNAYLTLSALFSSAADDRLIEHSPVKLPRGARPKKKRREIPAMTTQDIAAITREMPADWQIAVILAAWCALRFGEIAALQRKDIDLKRGLLTVRATTRRGIGGAQSIGAPKSAAGLRTIAIPPPALEALKEHLEQFVKPQNNALIIHMRGNPSKWITNKSLHLAFDPAAARAGFPGLRFHDLRHWSLTMTARAGATTAELMARGGHSSPETAMIYQHASLERDRALAERMSHLE